MAKPQKGPSANLDMMEQINFTLIEIRREVTAVEQSLAFLCYVMIWTKCAKPDGLFRPQEARQIKDTETMFHKLCQDFTRTRQEASDCEES